MLIVIPLLAEWQTIICIREALICDALLETNQHYINYDNFVRQGVLKYEKSKGKLAVMSKPPACL